MASKFLATTVMIAALVLAAAPACAQDRPTPTDANVDLYGYATNFNLEPGDTVSAYAASGALCGQCTVRHRCAYGFLHAYRDDPATPEVEGARAGEAILLRVNGEPVECAGPDQPTWTRDGDKLRVDLKR